MQHRLRRVAHDLFGRFVEVVSDPLVDHAEKPVHEKGAQVSGVLFLFPVGKLVERPHDGGDQPAAVHQPQQFPVLVHIVQKDLCPVFLLLLPVLFRKRLPLGDQLEHQQLLFAALGIEVAVVSGPAHARALAHGADVDGLVALFLHHSDERLGEAELQKFCALFLFHLQCSSLFGGTNRPSLFRIRRRARRKPYFRLTNLPPPRILGIVFETNVPIWFNCFTISVYYGCGALSSKKITPAPKENR